MNLFTKTLMLIAGLALVACAAESPAPTSADPAPVADEAPAEPSGDAMGVDRVAAIAAEIVEDPARTVEILEAAGLDEDAFRALLFGIASDPESSKAYLAARQ